MRTRLLEARLQEGVLHRREEPGQPGSLLLGVHRERAWPLLFSWVRSAWLSFNTPGGLSDGTRNFEWGRGSQARGCLPPPTFLPEAAPTCQEPGSLAHPSRIRRVPWQGLPETKDTTIVLLAVWPPASSVINLGPKTHHPLRCAGSRNASLGEECKHCRHSFLGSL